MTEKTTDHILLSLYLVINIDNVEWKLTCLFGLGIPPVSQDAINTHLNLSKKKIIKCKYMLGAPVAGPWEGSCQKIRLDEGCKLMQFRRSHLDPLNLLIWVSTAV